MTVTVLFFAHYQDIVGSREQTRILPDGATVRTLAESLAGDHPRLDGLLSYARVAVNADYAGAGTALHDGDEVALMPPMSGGNKDGPHPASFLGHPLPRLGEGRRLRRGEGLLWVRAQGKPLCRKSS